MRKNCSGFTMIEVLAALAILLVAFYVLMELRQNAIKCAIYSSKRLLAVQVARMKMEETIAKGFPDPTMETDEIAGLPVLINVQDIGDETSLGELRKIQVAVKYDIGFGENNQVVLTTIVNPMRLEILPEIEDNSKDTKETEEKKE